MAAEDLSRVLFNPGRLCYGPTDLTAAFPHGGTVLGLVRDIMLSPSQVTTMIRAEELGQTVVDAVEGGRSWVLGANLRGWDNDAVNQMFPRTSLNTVTGFRGIIETTTTPKAGALLSSRSVVLLFSPDDLDRHPMILMRRALPLIDESAELLMHLRSEFVVPVMFLAIPDTSGRVIEVDLRNNITL